MKHKNLFLIAAFMAFVFVTIVVVYPLVFGPAGMGNKGPKNEPVVKALKTNK